MALREQDRHFLWSLYAAVAVIFVWKGVWDGVYFIPFFPEESIPYISLTVGSFMLVLSGFIFKEFDPLGGLSKAADKIAHQIYNHPEKKHFQVKYYDKVIRKTLAFPAGHIQKIERGALVVKDYPKTREIFIPLHRVTEVIYKGKSYWRL